MSTTHTNTLQNLFPPPRPVPRKNFIKENMKHIKEMQGLVQNSIHQNLSKNDKFRNVPEGNSASSLIRNRSGPIKSAMLYSKVRNSSNRSLNKSKTEKAKVNINQLKDLGVDRGKHFSIHNDEKRTDRSVQTERTSNIKEIYESGVIRYPSINILKEIKDKKINGYGDTPSKMTKNGKVEQMIENLSLDNEKKNVRDNSNSAKFRNSKCDVDQDPNRAPPYYKKGVVPKYIKEQKEEKEKTIVLDNDCPPGHVLLPDDERKETLRVLRQSYADRIQELNSMPVRNDTLRMRRRKMEIEEELKKIDEGIKVFQRPKVFVKINA